MHSFLHKPILQPEKEKTNLPENSTNNQRIKHHQISSVNNPMDDANPIFDADLLNTILLQGSNDYLLNIGNSDYFDKSSMDAEGNGFEIIEQINELGVFRIKIKNPLSFAKFLDENENDFESIRAMFFGDVLSAYTILEVDQSASDRDVKKAYRKMATKYHPDKVGHLGKEIIKLAEEKFKAVNDAYQSIKKERGIN